MIYSDDIWRSFSRIYIRALSANLSSAQIDLMMHFYCLGVRIAYEEILKSLLRLPAAYVIALIASWSLEISRAAETFGNYYAIDTTCGPCVQNLFKANCVPAMINTAYGQIEAKSLFYAGFEACINDYLNLFKDNEPTSYFVEHIPVSIKDIWEEIKLLKNLGTQ